ncbi:hypothetical protein JHE00_28745 [Prauserella sp. ASG 168]|uniref:Esterase-like activity of phytase family protein n=1 Tax=Prauserella cavernicola TaxID=2800127 RepID=A0A934V4G0_9PSEU|nr:hypothetical protein [Prauserella cavernicola]
MLACGVLPASAQASAPEQVCSLADERLDEVSGLAADGDNWYAVNDGGTSIEIFVLGKDCSVRGVIENPTDPYDVEDMALAQDGTLWLGDTGDNRKRRDTVALHAVSPDGSSTLYRLTYPDGAHDAEALLLDRSGTPYIITKNVLGNSVVYRPAGPLTSPGPTPLENVGSLAITTTDTPGGPVGPVGSMLVTGAASNADSTVFAVRTYTDAYLYPAPDGDVLAALRRSPVRVPLPDEQQGEAIAFDPDGSLVSVSEGVGSPVRIVRGAADLAATAGQNTESEEQAASPSAGDPAPASDEDSSGVPVLPGIAIAVGVAAVLVFGVGKLRRR